MSSIIKRFLFVLLSSLSYVLRPLRHRYYMVVLQKAYEIEGVKFNGKASYIDYRSYIDNAGRITLGDNIVISLNVIILSHDWSPNVVKKIAPPDNKISPCKFAPVYIGDNSFIGAGAIILPGTTIGKYCIIGAGAVVKGKIPDYSVVIGNPCKIIKHTK